MIQMRLGKRAKSVLLFGACILAVLGAWLAIEREARQKGVLVDQPTESPEQSFLPEEVDGFVRPEGLSDEAWNVAISSHNIRKSANREINFYGKMIDQNGEPVPGVRIEIEAFGYETSFLNYATTGTTQTRKLITLLTDNEGVFKIEKEKGTSISIEEIAKEGYLRPGRGIKYSYSFNNLVSGPNASMYHQPDKNNPVVFPVWEKGETEPLIRARASLSVDPAEEKPEAYYSFALNERPSHIQMEDWDVKVSGWLEYGESRYDPDTWEVNLTAPEGGGFILTEDIHYNLAPEEGYSNKLTFKSSDYDPAELRRKITYRAYYRNADGSKYAAFRFYLTFSGRNGKGSFGVYLRDIRINPNGSRNLEFDPRKEIREYP